MSISSILLTLKKDNAVVLYLKDGHIVGGGKGFPSRRTYFELHKVAGDVPGFRSLEVKPAGIALRFLS